MYLLLSDSFSSLLSLTSDPRRPGGIGSGDSTLSGLRRAPPRSMSSNLAHEHMNTLYAHTISSDDHILLVTWHAYLISVIHACAQPRTYTGSDSICVMYLHQQMRYREVHICVYHTIPVKKLARLHTPFSTSCGTCQAH